jgi:hypothetical protein
MLNLRYLAPLLPVIFAAVGTLVAEGLQLRQVGALPASPRRAYKMPALPVLGLGLIVAFVVAHPVLYLRTYYEQAARLGRTNEHYLEVIELIKTHRRSDEVVIIDQLLESRNLGAGSAWSGSVFRTALAVEHVPYQVSDVRSGESIGSATRCRGALLLASRQPEIGEDVAARLELRGLDDRPGGATRMGRYALYRLDRQPGVC